MNPCKCGSNTHQRTSHSACPLYKPKIKKRYREDDLPKQTSVVITGLKPLQILNIQPILLEVTAITTKLAIEGSRFFNAFLIYSIGHGVHLPNVSQERSFFDCLFRVFESKGDNLDEGKAVSNPLLNHFFTSQYVHLRGALPYSNTGNLTTIVKYASNQYRVSCMNHVVENFEQRVKFWLSYKIRKHCLWFLPEDKVGVFANFIVTCLNENRDIDFVIPPYISDAVQEENQATLAEATGFLIGKTRFLLDGLPMEPTQDNWFRYFPVLYAILQRIEKHYNNADTASLFTGRKNLKPRLFSLAPVCSFKSKHIHLDTTGLYYVLKRDDYDLPTLETFREQAQVSVPLEKPKVLGEYVNDWGFDYNANYHPLNIQLPQSVLGLDPGRSSLYTAVSGHLPEQRYHCTNRRWREISGATYSQKKVKAWMKSNVQMRQTVTDLPTPCTAHWNVFSQHLWYLYSFLPDILEFYGQLRWKRLRFKTRIKREQAYDTLCKELVDGDPNRVIAYGGGSFDHASRGYPPTPRKHFFKQLKKRCTVRLTPEFRTSARCSYCFEEMEQTKIWAIKLCGLCRIRWNRDINASRNIRRILIHRNENNGERPAPFRRD